ncbi:GtrA family protein [Humibacillus sp. DSM 29435]|uniref:GtrA family protein n=1 Tax=Humibacillus sp. DSM 29435 TaxID=1869167 RepID=UPI0020C7D5C0|nr:GtrA family protein [Humibacillus sp. DSM 29435]
MSRPDEQREPGSGRLRLPVGSDSSGAPVGRPEAPTPTPTLPAGLEGPPGLLLRVVHDRRVAFLLVGGLNTVIGALWFLLFDHLIGARWGGHGHYPALVLTYVAAILCAFVLYRRLVFRVHGHVLRDLARFSTVYVSAFAVNIVLLGLLVDGLGWRPFPSQCLITFVTTVFSWVGHHRFSFRRPGVRSVDGEARGAASDAGDPIIHDHQRG